MIKKGGFDSTHLVFEELEPRLLLSADGLAVITESSVATLQNIVHTDNEYTTIAQQYAELSSTHVLNKSQSSPSAELVIIDSRAPNFQQLHNDVISAQQQGRDINVLILDAHRDGIQQISEALSKYNKLDAVHIVSHGESGKLQLGATQLDNQNLKQRAEEIKQWQAAFVEAGDLLLYGCNLTASSDGQSLVNELAKQTQTDVAASDDLTGNSILGGDWELEYQTGEIESSLAFSDNLQQNWQGTLAAPVANNDSYSVNEDETLIVNASTVNTTATDLAASWQFDEGSGTTTSDTTGNSSDSTINGATWSTSSRTGGAALVFDGTNDFVQTEPLALDLKTANNFTLSAWFKTDTTIGQHHLLWQGVSTENGWGEPTTPSNLTSEMHLTVGDHDLDNKITFFLGNTNLSGNPIDITSASNFTDTSTWHHAVVVVSDLGGGILQADLYVDGVLEGSDSGDQNDRSQWDSDLRIGQGGSELAGRNFDGMIDEVAVYDRALTPAEAVNLYQTGVILNDTDADGDILFASLAVAPANGSLAFNVDGSFTYTPVGDFNGSDTFSYVVNDGVSISNVATVTINVNAVNDAPAGSVTIAGIASEDQTLTASNTLADVDGMGAVSYQWQRGGVDIAGATLNTYTLGDADVGNTISVVASYSDGGSTLESVSSAGVGPVANVNDIPAGLPVITGTVTEDQTLTADTTGISDADGLGIFSYQWIRDGADITGATSNTYILGDADVGAQISVRVSYTDAHSTAESLTSASTAAVVNINDPAIIAGVDTGNVTEDVDPDLDTFLETSGLLTITDVDAGQANFTAGTIAGLYGNLTIDAAGNWNYRAANSQPVIQNLAASASLTDTISVSSVDGTTHNVTITIAGANDAPVAQNDNPVAVDEGGTAIFDLAINDSDIDNALDLSSIVITAGPANGSLLVNANGTVSYTHDGSETLSDSFSYSIADISGAVSNTATVNVTVNPLNDAPSAADDSQTVDEGNTINIDLAVTASDVDNAVDLNSIVILSAPVNGTLTVNANGTVDYAHDGSQTLSDSFSYTIADVSGALSNVATVNITVNPVNNAPTTAGIVDVVVTEDSAATSIDLDAAFDDVDNLDSELTYSITGNTSIGLFTTAAVNATTGELVLDYAADMNGSSQISMRATDPSGAFVDTLFTVTVTASNDAPVMVQNSGMTATGTTNTLITNAQLNVNDIDNADTSIVYTVTVLPTNGVLLINGVAATVNSSFTEDDIVNNRVSYQASLISTDDQFEFTVTDGVGGMITGNSFNIVMQIAPPEPEVTPADPVIPDDPAVTVTPDDPNDFQPTVLATEAGVEQSAVSELEDWYTGTSRTTPQPPELTLEPEPQADAEPVLQDNFGHIQNNDVALQNKDLSTYNVKTATTYADIQVQSIQALLIAIDEMKEEMDDKVTENISKLEFRAAAVSSSGVALTAGVVAWVLRSGALMTSLISTIPLWKGYDPLPIMAYRDDEDENNEKDITEDKIPTSLEEMKKVKALKEKMNKYNQIDALFGGSREKE